MKKLLKSTVLAASIVGCGATGALATPVLWEYGFNVDGAITNNAAATGVDMTGFDNWIGLGTITYTYTNTSSALGTNSFLAFFDHEIEEATNTWFNETGSTTGTVAAGQSWEIDEPGYGFGDIYWNFEDNTLDNDIFDGNTSLADDVSMAMGWNFNLLAGQTADITLSLTDSTPLSGFYLTQFDTTSGESIYFSSNLTITGGGGPAPVPEPATMLLFGTGLAGLFGANRRKKRLSNQ